MAVREYLKRNRKPIVHIIILWDYSHTGGKVLTRPELLRDLNGSLTTSVRPKHGHQAAGVLNRYNPDKRSEGIRCAFPLLGAGHALH